MLYIKSLNSFKIITICNQNKFILKVKKKKTVAKIKENIKKFCLVLKSMKRCSTRLPHRLITFLHSVKRIHEYILCLGLEAVNNEQHLSSKID